MTEVLTGAADWRIEEWKDSYYPGDLPEEWQLAYYANEFGTTLIDCREFSDPQRLDVLAEMLEDCAYSFRPILRVYADANTPDQVRHFMPWLKRLGLLTLLLLLLLPAAEEGKEPKNVELEE